MKISLNWLNEFVDLSDYTDKPEALSDLLTAAGLEVEATENLKKQFENVVIGQILRKGQHPDAERLTVCEVTTGEAVIHQIVCGAKNHQEDDYVVAALPGAVLPGDFKIKTSKLRGVESQGMLCSAKELGLEGDSEGIMILDRQTAKVGQSIAEYLGLDDVLFELKVTPNRADCLSHFGLAREIASLLGRELIKPAAKIETQGSTKSLVDVQLVNADLCPRYAGRAIRGVKVGESPAWLKSRLEKLGMNSINNIVDVTNYVMLELGQPLHAFDIKKVAGPKLIIDKSKAGEAFQSLDGTEYKLTGEELMIRDADRPVALAGVVGGLNSGVDESTTEIFVESAYFVPQTVRRSARAFGIDTDSAYRFSRGVDPTGTDFARDRACYLIQTVAGGQIAGDEIDLYPQPVKIAPISLNTAKVTESLGYEVETKDLVEVLERLGCVVNIEDGATHFEVLPPAFRVDLEQDMDLVEEYARVNGYDKIPESLPASTEPPRAHDGSFDLHQKIGEWMLASGFSEAQNFAFTQSSYQTELMGSLPQLKALGLGERLETAIFLKNPLNEELDVMRSWLSPSLFRNAISNQRKGNEEGRLFEIAPSFGTGESGSYLQEFRLSLVAWGEGKDLWQKSSIPQVYKVKAAIEDLLKALHISSYKWVQEVPSSGWPPLFHPGQCAVLVVEGRKLGVLGSLHPALKEEQKLRAELAFAELNLESLLKGQPRSYRVKPISKFPAVERDLSLTMPKSLAAGEIVASIEKLAGPQLKKVTVFDVYSGDNLPEDQKSVSFRMKLQSPDSTLSDKELSALQEKVIEGLEKAFAVRIR